LLTPPRWVRNQCRIRALLMWPRQGPTVNSRRCNLRMTRTPPYRNPARLQGVDHGLSGPARAWMILSASASVGFIYGCSPCCPSGSVNVSLGRPLLHRFSRPCQGPDITNALSGRAAVNLCGPEQVTLKRHTGLPSSAWSRSSSRLSSWVSWLRAGTKQRDCGRWRPR